MPLQNSDGKQGHRYDGSQIVSFERIGVIPILVFLGYLSSASLLIGGLIIVIVKDGLAATHIMIQDRVAHSKLGNALYKG
eukprot:3604179-Rhodomonas_salina.1